MPPVKKGQLVPEAAPAMPLPPAAPAAVQANPNPAEAPAVGDPGDLQPLKDAPADKPEAPFVPQRGGKIAKELTTVQRMEILRQVRATRDYYQETLRSWRNLNLRIYDAAVNYENPRAAEWSTNFKINKAFVYENKWLSRLFAKNPRWVVSLRSDQFDPDDAFLSPEELQAKQKDRETMSEAVQDYLTNVFDRDGQKERLRRWVRAILRYGLAFADIEYKYKKVWTRTKKGGREIKTVEEYPTLKVRPFTDVYFDPRYQTLDEMPAVIFIKEKVRVSELLDNPDYENAENLKNLPALGEWTSDQKTYRDRVMAIAGIPLGDQARGIDREAMKTTKYVGKFTMPDKSTGEIDPANESLWKFEIAADQFIISAQEIDDLPLECGKLFEDTDSFLARGIIEPILGLQEELNMKRNAGADMINQSIYRTFFWSPTSGINPSDLQSKPGNIIPTSGPSAHAAATDGVYEQPFRAVPQEYFQEGAQFERDFQEMTFSVNADAPMGQNALTNTATGARIKFFEADSVSAFIRRQIETAFESVAYKFLRCAYENAKSNITLKRSGVSGWWEINKEALRDAESRYVIKIDADSSSFEDTQSRRDEALAEVAVAQSAKMNGINVDMEEVYKDVFRTFAGVRVDKIIKPSMPAAAPADPNAPAGPGGVAPMQLPGMPTIGALNAPKMDESILNTIKASGGGEKLFGA